MRKRFCGFAATVTALVALSGCASLAPEPEPEPLTVTEAGARYLDAVCPVNDAWDEVDVEVDRLRIAMSRGDRGDTSGYVAALAALERASRAGATTLTDPLVSWPDAAEAAVAEVSQSLDADADHTETAAALSAAEIVDYRWPGATGIAETATQARVALGLPEDPASACAEREASPEQPSDDASVTAPAPTR